jgi:cation diffusion facilitator CzcD-associated flavoprotein CzcO
MASRRDTYRIAIVGAGPAGITLGRLLQLEGFKNGRSHLLCLPDYNTLGY